MDLAGFSRFLRKKGKKENVIHELVLAVETYLDFLSKINMDADNASVKELEDFASSLATKNRKNILRGVALYNRFTGNLVIAEHAASIREQELQASRRSIKLRDFLGVDPKTLQNLEETGITDADGMIHAAKDAHARAVLSERTGIAPGEILELVKLSDLSRLFSVKTVRTRLYVDAGVDTPDRLAQWEAEPLRLMLADFIKHSGFKGIAPLPKEMKCTIDAARKLPRIVEY